MTGRLLSVQDVAERSALSTKAVRSAIARGELAAFKLGARVKIDEDDYAAWLESSRIRPGARVSRPSFPTRARPPRGRLSAALADLESATKSGPALRKQPGPMAHDEGTVMHELEPSPSSPDVAP